MTTLALWFCAVVVTAGPSATLVDAALAKPSELVALDPATMTSLLKQGSLVLVKQNADLTLHHVTAGQLVDAPLDAVWATITDLAGYSKYVPQTEGIKILSRSDDNHLLVEQSVKLKIWHLPSINIKNQLTHELQPPRRIRFKQVSGDLPGTWGGWDLVPVGAQTMLFYTLYSNLTEVGWGLGAIFIAEPDYMAGINATTALTVARAIKQEAERRVKK